MSRPAVAAVVVILVGLIGAYAAHLHQATGRAHALADVVPANAGAVLWVDGVGQTFSQLTALGQRVEGAAGVPDALAAAMGLSAATPDALADAGLIADAGIAIFVWEDAAWVVGSLAPGLGIAHVSRWVAQRGWSLAPTEVANSWHLKPGPSGAAVGNAWLRDSRFVARLPVPKAWRGLLGNAPVANQKDKQGTPPVRPPEEAIARYEAAEKGLPTSEPGSVHVHAALSHGDAVRPAVRRAIGLASLLFGGLVDNIRGLAGALQLQGQSVRASINLWSVPKANSDIAAYHDGFLPKGSAPLALGQVLPDEIALWSRAHINPKLMDMIPSFIRSRVLPATLLRPLHPALAKVDARKLLLDRLEGRFAVGLLGIDDGAPLDPRSWRRTGLQRVLGGFAATTFVTPNDATALQGACRQALTAAGEKTQELKLGQWQGWTGTIMDNEVSLLRKDNALLVISGKGERARFERVARGRFPAMGKAVATTMESAMVADTIGWIGVASTTGRIARAARRRGVPDAFVRMIRSVAAFTAAVGLNPNGTHLALELRPRAPSGAKP